MKKIQHSIEINASKEKIWETLWSDKTFRDWSNIIDEGTYLDGELEEGNEINFIGSSEGGASYGVTSKIEKLIPNQFILLAKTADIIVDKDGKIEKRAEQWTGGMESYELEDNNGNVKLTIIEEIPDELLEYFDAKIPEVLKRVKVLSEN
jgi:hypothetical protein